jgi:hypothetical protein
MVKTLLNVPPGFTVPESQVIGMVVSLVDVWGTEVDVFVQSAVFPCATVAVFGEKVRLFVIEMLTVAAMASPWMSRASSMPRNAPLLARRSMRILLSDPDPNPTGTTGRPKGGILP